jgi:hypothetical protein
LETFLPSPLPQFLHDNEAVLDQFTLFAIACIVMWREGILITDLKQVTEFTEKYDVQLKEKVKEIVNSGSST